MAMVLETGSQAGAQGTVGLFGRCVTSGGHGEDASEEDGMDVVGAPTLHDLSERSKWLERSRWLDKREAALLQRERALKRKGSADGAYSGTLALAHVHMPITSCNIGRTNLSRSMTLASHPSSLPYRP